MAAHLLDVGPKDLPTVHRSDLHFAAWPTGLECRPELFVSRKFPERHLFAITRCERHRR